MTLISNYKFKKVTILFWFANQKNPNPKLNCCILFWMNVLFHRCSKWDQLLLNSGQDSESSWSSAPVGLGFGNLSFWVPPAWSWETPALKIRMINTWGQKRRTSFWKQKQLLPFPKHFLFNCAFFSPPLFFFQTAWHLKWSKFPVNHSF